MAPKVEKLPLPRLLLGEGPHWSPETESLYVVDILNSTVCRYHPATDKCYTLKVDVPSVSFIIPVEGVKDTFLISGGTSLYTIKWDGVSSSVDSLDLVASLKDEPKTNRINDAKCDPIGRIWFGTMKINEFWIGRESSFYSYSKKEGVVKHFSDVGISNGTVWNKKKNTMYYNDSLNKTIDAFDYSTDGKIENRRVLLDLLKNNLDVFPDGMTIDEDDKLWCACFGGSQVVKIDPDTGKILDQVNIPVLNVTSAAWGGPNLSDLYVTTAGFDATTTAFSEDKNSGCTYKVTGLPARGLPMVNFKLN